MKILLLLLAVFISVIASGQDKLCFANQRNCEKGYVGEINGIKLFYEVWNVKESLGYHLTSLILRTDTSNIEYYDFCFDMEKQTDSISITLIRPDITKEYKTVDANKVPTLFQTLIRSEYTIDQYYDFNKPGSGKSLYIKDNKLYLSYIHSPPFEEGQTIHKVYEFSNGQFKLKK